MIKTCRVDSVSGIFVRQVNTTCQMFVYLKVKILAYMKKTTTWLDYFLNEM